MTQTQKQFFSVQQQKQIIPARMDHDVGPSIGGPCHEMLLRQREMITKFYKGEL